MQQECLHWNVSQRFLCLLLDLWNSWLKEFRMNIWKGGSSTTHFSMLNLPSQYSGRATQGKPTALLFFLPRPCEFSLKPSQHIFPTVLRQGFTLYRRRAYGKQKKNRQPSPQEELLGKIKLKKKNNPHIKRRNRKKRIRCYLLVNTVIDLADLETTFEFTTNRVTM